MCQQGWSTLRLSSLPQWQNQKKQLGRCPPQSLHRRQFLSPSKRMAPTGTKGSEWKTMDRLYYKDII